MKRILVLGAGGSPSTNFIRSLRKAREKFYIVGTDADKFTLVRAETDKKYLTPLASDPSYLEFINLIIAKEHIDFVHAQNEAELKILSDNREKVKAKMFLPSKETVRICFNKFLSYEAWRKTNIKVPKTMMINNTEDLRNALKEYKGRMWLRAVVGGGGKGAFPIKNNNFNTAKAWIDFNNGWGKFTAAELLQPDSITWMSIWKDGNLIVAQGRKRLYWELSRISPSGVTGITGGGVTVNDKNLDETAIKAIHTMDKKPHGLYGVDLTYDNQGVINPTEINVGRFFTTHYFFTALGLNMPYIFVKLAFDEKIPKIRRKLNPLKPGMLWIRGVDFEPILTSMKEVEQYAKSYEKLILQCRKKK